MDFKEITSQNNTRIKWLKKLSQKKYRRQNKEFTVENLTTIYDALKSGCDFKDLIVTKEFVQKNKLKFEYLIKESRLKEYYLVDEDLNKFYSQLDTPSGITAVYEIKRSALDLCKSVIYLNGIKDPGNMGNILRCALAFDVRNIVLDETCVDVHNSKVINSAKDAIFKLNIIQNEDIDWLKKISTRFPLYVADAQNGVDFSQVKAQDKFCLVLGSESHGVSEDIIQLADTRIRINISENIESLNVASAAAILLYGLRGTNGR